MRKLRFRHRVIALAVALVTVIQLVTLVPVLRAIERDVERQTQQKIDLAGIVFEEFMRNRAAQLLTTVNVLVSDYGFKQAWSSGDDATIRSALLNHAGRVGATVGLLLELDGDVAVSTSDLPRPRDDEPLAPTAEAALVPAAHRVLNIGGSPYQTVTVPLRAPETVAWVVLGFPIDESLAERVRSLTGLDVSFVRFGAGEPEVTTSTLPREEQTSGLATLNPQGRGVQRMLTPDATGELLVLLLSFLPGSSDGGMHVALELSLNEATASYRQIRAILLFITGSSLLVAVTGAFWLARSVTRPVEHLVAAARRMREGVYTEPISSTSNDELGELAGSFNAMQEAIADRERRIVHQAQHDSLSGLPNREFAAVLLRGALETAERLAVVDFAIERLDGIVASLGHRAGEEVIKLVATMLGDRAEDGQIVGHLGGNEFLIALPDRDAQQAAQWFDYFAEQLRAGVRVNGANISLEAAAGIACFPEHSTDAAELCRRASTARGDARARHLLSAEYEIGQEDRALTQIKIVGDFPRAIAENELVLCLQPKIDCRTRAPVGAEALVRWQHPELGLLMPSAFVDAVEQAGGIAHLTRWVLRQALAECRRWRDHDVALGVAVNISVDDLADEYLPYFLLELVQQHDLKPGDVTLEVTESAIMHNVQKSLAVVTCIHELGFRLAIDDFGTGQSALAQLKRLPVDELKIDKSFVMNLGDSRDRAIVRTTLELAHELELGVVAEGVESETVLESLSALGCEHAQGFHISKPLPAADFLSWLDEWDTRPERPRRAVHLS